MYNCTFIFPLLRYLTGMVDKRTLEKYEREAKEKNRETWYELTEDSSTLCSFTAMKLAVASVPVALASSRQYDALVLGGFFVHLLFGLGFVVVFWLVGFWGAACVYTAHAAA